MRFKKYKNDIPQEYLAERYFILTFISEKTLKVKTNYCKLCNS